jgi:hypothetical protein
LKKGKRKLNKEMEIKNMKDVEDYRGDLYLTKEDLQQLI